MLVAKKLGLNDVLAIGVVVLVFSLILDKFLRLVNKGKALFPYQKIIIPFIFLSVAILMAKFVL